MTNLGLLEVIFLVIKVHDKRGKCHCLVGNEVGRRTELKDIILTSRGHTRGVTAKVTCLHKLS